MFENITKKEALLQITNLQINSGLTIQRCIFKSEFKYPK